MPYTTPILIIAGLGLAHILLTRPMVRALEARGHLSGQWQRTALNVCVSILLLVALTAAARKGEDRGRQIEEWLVRQAAEQWELERACGPPSREDADRVQCIEQWWLRKNR